LQLTVTRSGNVITQYNTAWIAGLAIVVFAASIVSIISFKNRLRQIQIGLVISVLLSAILGGIVYYTFKAKDLAVDMNNGTFGIGLIIPAFSLLLNNLSNRFIRKDEELVRSADRLR
jgi:TctA family transporter